MLSSRSDVSRFTKAVREAAAILNGGSASPSEWLHIVRQCDLLLAGTDKPIRSAVAVGRLVVPEPKRNRRTTLARMGLNQDPWEPVSQREREELRAVALYLTRAATRETEGSSRLLLARVERSMLATAAPSRSFEDALRGWGHALAAPLDGMDPAGAQLVSRIQYGLFTGGAELLKNFEVTDGVGHDRLAVAVEASRQEWARAYSTWRGLVPRNARSATDFQPAISALQLAAQGADDTERLGALLATGFGANLTAALAVTPADMRAESVLVASALVLESRSDLASTFQPRESSLVPASSVVAAVVERVGPAVASPASLAASPPGGVVSPQFVEIERPRIEDHAALNELAGVRDAGVVAQAARSGVEEALQLIGGSTPGEVDELIERGLQARAAIAASGVAAVLHWAVRVPPDRRDQFISEASERVAGLVDRWDPKLSRWGNFAFGEVGFEFREGARRREREREVPSDRLGDYSNGLERVLGPVMRSPEDLVVEAVEQQTVQQLVERLPYRLRVLAEGRLDDTTRGPSTLAMIGARVGRSESTVHRDEADAHRLLRGYYAESHAAPTPTAVSLRQLAQALKPPTESAISILEQRKWGPPAAQSRPPAR